MMSGTLTERHLFHNIDAQKEMDSLYNETLTAKNVTFAVLELCVKRLFQCCLCSGAEAFSTLL